MSFLLIILSTPWIPNQGSNQQYYLIRPENSASRRVAQKLGEKMEGTTDIFGSEAMIYGISQKDWQIVTLGAKNSGSFTEGLYKSD